MDGELEAALAAVERILSRNKRNKFSLPPSLNRLLTLLLTSEIVSSQTICEALSTEFPKQAVKRLREHLEPHEISIKTERNEGYYFDDDTKALVRKLLTAEVTVQDEDAGMAPTTPSTAVA